MTASSRLRMPLLAAGAGAFAAGAALLVFGGERVAEGARLAAARAAPVPSTPRAHASWDFVLCHNPTDAAATRGMIRLAATQIEVPQAKSNADVAGARLR